MLDHFHGPDERVGIGLGACQVEVLGADADDEQLLVPHGRAAGLRGGIATRPGWAPDSFGWMERMGPPAPELTRRAEKKFMAGLPMKPATKRLAGAS